MDPLPWNGWVDLILTGSTTQGVHPSSRYFTSESDTAHKVVPNTHVFMVQLPCTPMGSVPPILLGLSPACFSFLMWHKVRLPWGENISFSFGASLYHGLIVTPQKLISTASNCRREEVLKKSPTCRVRTFNNNLHGTPPGFSHQTHGSTYIVHLAMCVFSFLVCLPTASERV